MVLSIGMFSSSHSTEILSKHPLMSASRTHVAELGFDSALKQACIASAHDLPSLKPYEFPSAVVSATGASANLYNACIALSFIVGIDRGRFLPFFFRI
jgi:hypothetical protein